MLYRISLAKGIASQHGKLSVKDVIQRQRL